MEKAVFELLEEKAAEFTALNITINRMFNEFQARKNAVIARMSAEKKQDEMQILNLRKITEDLKNAHSVRTKAMSDAKDLEEKLYLPTAAEYSSLAELLDEVAGEIAKAICMKRELETLFAVASERLKDTRAHTLAKFDPFGVGRSTLENARHNLDRLKKGGVL